MVFSYFYYTPNFNQKHLTWLREMFFSVYLLFIFALGENSIGSTIGCGAGDQHGNTIGFFAFLLVHVLAFLAAGQEID